MDNQGNIITILFWVLLVASSARIWGTEAQFQFQGGQFQGQGQFQRPQQTSPPRPPQRVERVGVGDHCAPGGAPSIGPGGRPGPFQVVPSNTRVVCPPGTSCRNGACNCNNFRDGTVTGISVDFRGNRSCRRVAGQRCSGDNQCFDGVRCIRGFCTCPRRDDFYCVDAKNDYYILA